MDFNLFVQFVQFVLLIYYFNSHQMEKMTVGGQFRTCTE